ncbi:MAG: serine/threonine-protein kinase [Syntrophorhabdaceae bacterium]|nr:serine/threonine-protein kinase [Syntrophorhabdaceae bacterium]MDD5242830.1 serine/threonine-protein kinase [Syntrophorhabdaceae bacterium]
MDYNKRWEIVRKIGEGGQGKVYLVYDRNQMGLKPGLIGDLTSNLRHLSDYMSMEDRSKTIQSVKEMFKNIVDIADERNHGALKVLHQPEDARDPKLVYERIRNEIKAMAKVSYPNLVKILDYDSDGKWLVTKYYPRGNLGDFLKGPNPFTGNIVNALKAFRPLVAAVAELHNKSIVHRDIKPENIFIGPEGDLNLGDFGLVFFENDSHTRFSDTFENVGSRDWMPAWAYSYRIENVKPSFDVFSLGKVLWRMISDTPVLPLWYFDHPEHNLIRKFPKARSISFINALFKQCIVEREENCLQTATELLDRIDDYLWYADIHADGPGSDIVRNCKVCGIGNYKIITDNDQSEIENFGLSPRGIKSFKIFSCSHCGHVQLFYWPNEDLPKAWQ